MGAWTHAICDRCWGQWRGPRAYELVSEEPVACCVCRQLTGKGRRVVVEPEGVGCRGEGHE